VTLAQLIRETDPANLDWDTPRIWRAIMLAPTLEVCVALLNREPVPVSRLDPAWVKALGLAS
jgi:hypothetical protein